MEAYNDYLLHGISPRRGGSIYLSSFYITGKEKLHMFGYSTSIFTAIILTSATGVNIDFALWYLYPLIFIFTPFFFYSVFQKFSNKEGKCDLSLIILTILAMLTTSFLKLPHSATTMVLGAYVFLILVIEFFDLMHEREILFKIMNFLFIVFLYFFLCITHFEECIYFLLVIFLYCIYFLFFEIKKTHSFNVFDIKNQIGTSKKKLKNNFEVENNYYTLKYLKGTLIMSGFLLVILLLIFYLIQEFFGNILFYYTYYIKDDKNFLSIIKPVIINFYNDYEKTLVNKTPFLKESFRFSPFIILMIFLGIAIWTTIIYLIFFKFYCFLFGIYEKIIFIIKKIFIIINKILSLKFFQLLIFPIFFCAILLIDLLYYPFLQEDGFLLIIELILNYTIIIFSIFLFFKGILYYKIDNDKQNYFLISIIAISSIMVLSFIVGNIFVSYHLLNSKFLSIFIIFNLIIIQNTYFKDFMKKKKIHLFLFMILLLSLGVFSSLRMIGWE